MSNSNIDEILFKIRTTHEVEHNDNQWTTEFVYTLEEAKQAIQQELLKAKWEIVNMAKQRAEDDDVYTLQAFAEDMDTYLQAKLKGDDK